MANDPMKPTYTEGAFQRFDSPSFEAFAQVLHDFQIAAARVRQNLSRYDGADYIWRGQRDSSFDLRASAMRLVTPVEAHELEELDLQTFVQAASALGLAVPDKESVTTAPGFDERDVGTNYERLPARWKATALARHFGVPTTLLDWSQSAHVALGHAVWSAIEFLATCRDADSPSRETTPRIALWQLDPSAVDLPYVEIVWNSDPSNPRERSQRGVYTQVAPNNEFLRGDILDIAKAKIDPRSYLRCFTFPGSHVLMAYQWLLGNNVSPGTAYGGYEGAARDVLTERHLRMVRRRYPWIWEETLNGGGP